MCKHIFICLYVVCSQGDRILYVCYYDVCKWQCYQHLLILTHYENKVRKFESLSRRRFFKLDSKKHFNLYLVI